MKKILYPLKLLVVLFVCYLIIRYPLVSIGMHYMLGWPLDLFVVGAVVILISGLKQSKYVPLFTVFGYAVGFILGYLFQFDYGVLGRGNNSFWIIWTYFYLFCMIMGIIVDLYMNRKKRNDSFEKSKK